MSTLDQFIAEGITLGEERGEERGIALGEERGEERGIALGEERGEERGRILSAKIIKLYINGEPVVTIAERFDTTIEKVEKIIADYEAA